MSKISGIPRSRLDDELTKRNGDATATKTKRNGHVTATNAKANGFAPRPAPRVASATNEFDRFDQRRRRAEASDESVRSTNGRTPTSWPATASASRSSARRSSSSRSS
jgi:hypothetical protein